MPKNAADNGQVSLTAEDRRRRVDRVRRAAGRLELVETKLAAASFEVGSLLREVESIRSEITAATSVDGDEEE